MIRRLLPVLVFIALAALLVAGLFNAPYKEIIPSPLVGKPLPQFRLPVLNQPERTAASTELEGPYLLNIWGSWCPGCRVEHPLIEHIAQNGPVPVYGFNYKDEPADAARWLERYGDPYVFSFTDLPGKVAIDLGVYGAPETFVVDRRGIVRYKQIGPLSETDWRVKVKPLLERLNLEGQQ